MKNNLSYYSHDANSHNHWKFKTLRRKYKWEGEGKFWALNNMIAIADGCMLDLNDEERKASVAADLEMDLDEFDAFIDYLSKTCKLVVDVDQKIYTKKLHQTLSDVNDTRESKREWKRKKKMEKTGESNSTAGSVDGENQNSDGEKQQSKRKEKKVNKKKEDNKGLASDEKKYEITNPFSEDFLQVEWPEWKNYKLEEFKFRYRGKKSEKAAFDELVALSKKNEIAARKIIKKSMANGWKGFFELDKEDEPGAGVSIVNGNMHVKSVPQLSKIEQEINFLYGRFLEDQITVISIESVQYDFLKKAGKVKFDSEQVDQIRKKAEEYICEKNIGTEQTTLNFYMKKFGVIEYFKILKVAGGETVFNVDDCKNQATA